LKSRFDLFAFQPISGMPLKNPITKAGLARHFPGQEMDFTIHIGDDYNHIESRLIGHRYLFKESNNFDWL